MGWTYKALKDYDDPPEWLLEEREKQRILMREHRLEQGKRAVEMLARHAVMSFGSDPGPWRWPEFYAAWREMAEPAFGGAYLSKWCIAELARLGLGVAGSNTSKRERRRKLHPGGTPMRDADGRAVYEYTKGAKVDTRSISRVTPLPADLI